MRWVYLLGWVTAAKGQAILGDAPRAPEISREAPRAVVAATSSSWYDVTNRSTVANNYNQIFAPTVSVPMGWTGDVVANVPGTTTQAFKDAVATRINWFRAMAGVPTGITLDPTYSSEDQAAALIFSANRAISHMLTQSWVDYSAAGATAASNSNICAGLNNYDDPGCVLGYIIDNGSNNVYAGHRRWILYPQTQTMGTGDVPQNGPPANPYYWANALWVFDGLFGSTRPATRDFWVAWPPPGYVPYQVVGPRWSFSYPNADFTSATVIMTRNGSSVPVRLEAVLSGFGENTIVWVPDNQDASAYWYPTPVSSDTTAQVSISNVLINGAPQSFSYSVTIIDPSTSGGTGVSITVGTSPSGLSFTVDGTTYTSSQSFSWTAGSQHTIATTTPQAGATGTRYVFNNWSDAGAISHTVTGPASATTYTAGFTTQYLLTVNGGTGGTVGPSSTYYTAGQSVSLSATANSGYTFGGWTGTGTGSYSGSNASGSVTMNGPIQETAAFNSGGVSVSVGTSPSGLSFTVDGTTYTSAQSFSWTAGSQHTISTTTPQAGATGTRYVFNNWSDAGAISHTVTAPASATTYAASFTTQYLLTVSGASGGTVGPSSAYYTAGQGVSLSATANSGYTFGGWTGTGTGSYTGSNAAGSVTMNGPILEAATFSPTGTSVTVGTSQDGLSFTVDGTTYTSAQSFSWTAGSQHTISTTTPQAGASGTRYVFANWSDTGVISHTVTAPASATTYTATFTTQYLLTVSGGTGGTTGPSSAYYNAGQSVTLSATANSGYSFGGWTGTGTGSYTGSNAAGSVTMNGPVQETAAFNSAITNITVGTSPAGLSFTVDSTTYTSSQSFTWTLGSQHTISTTTPQAGATGTRYVFANWNDAGAISHTVTAPASATTYTASFTTQYLLTVNGGSGGTVGPSSAYYTVGQSVALSATANPGYAFSGWTGTGSGSYTGSTASASVTMNGPIQETAAFAVNVSGTPTVAGLSPAVSSGTPQLLTVSFNAPGGYQTLDVVNVLINNFLDGRNACYLAYSRSLNVLYIVPDNGDGTQLTGKAMDSTGAIANSQCTVTFAGSSAAVSGNTLTLVLNLSFSTSFGGNKVVYAAARDLAQNNSGWQTMGTHGVPPLPSTYPNAGGMNPSTGSTLSQTIIFTYQDQSNAANLQTVWALFNTALDGRAACYIAYYRPGNQLYLVPDNGDGTQATSIPLTGTATISNSQCTVSAQGALMQTNGNTLTLTLPITFKSSFAGFKGVWMAAQTMGGAQTSAWQALGAEAIPAQ
jgi:predicted heme/steroid binding protein